MEYSFSIVFFSYIELAIFYFFYRGFCDFFTIYMKCRGKYWLFLWYTLENWFLFKEERELNKLFFKFKLRGLNN